MVEEVSDLSRVKPSFLERITPSVKGTTLFAALCLLADLACVLGINHYDTQKNHTNNVNYSIEQTSLNTVQDGTLAVNNYHNQLPVHTISAAQDSVPPDTIEYKEGYWIYNPDSSAYLPVKK